MPGPVTCTTLHHRAGVEVQGQDTRPNGGASIEYQILILDLILDTRDLSGPTQRLSQSPLSHHGTRVKLRGETITANHESLELAAGS